MGYVSWIGKKDTDNSVLTTILLNAGAVLYVKTSVPQSLMVCETVNNIYGRTTNPRNKNWSCGGSSGGEGAIVALRGSVIGVGTDIGEFMQSKLSSMLDKLLTNNQAARFGFRQPLTSSTASGLVMAGFPTLRWPIVWKGKRLSTAYVDHLAIP